MREALICGEFVRNPPLYRKLLVFALEVGCILSQSWETLNGMVVHWNSYGFCWMMSDYECSW